MPIVLDQWMIRPLPVIVNSSNPHRTTWADGQLKNASNFESRLRLSPLFITIYCHMTGGCCRYRYSIFSKFLGVTMANTHDVNFITFDQLTAVGNFAHSATNFKGAGIGFFPPGGSQVDYANQGYTAQGSVTFHSYNFSTLTVQDNGTPNSSTSSTITTSNTDQFLDDDGNASLQTITNSLSLTGVRNDLGTGPVNFTTQPGWYIENEGQFRLRDPATGKEYLIATPSVNPLLGHGSTPTHYLAGVAFVDELPPLGVTLEVLHILPFYTYAINYDSFVTCLTRGTRVETADGPRPVESLKPGDSIITADGSAQPLQLLLSRALTKTDMMRNPNFVPVRISAGALGHGLPQRDLTVSQEHRMLLSSHTVQLLTGSDSALIAAKNMTSLPGVFLDHSAFQVEYFHLVFENHEIIYAEGAETESLLLSPSVLQNQTPEGRKEIQDLFGDQIGQPGESMPAAAFIPKTYEQQMIIRQLAA